MSLSLIVVISIFDEWIVTFTVVSMPSLLFFGHGDTQNLVSFMKTHYEDYDSVLDIPYCRIHMKTMAVL